MVLESEESKNAAGNGGVDVVLAENLTVAGRIVCRANDETRRDLHFAPDLGGAAAAFQGVAEADVRQFSYLMEELGMLFTNIREGVAKRGI